MTTKKSLSQALAISGNPQEFVILHKTGKINFLILNKNDQKDFKKGQFPKQSNGPIMQGDDF